MDYQAHYDRLIERAEGRGLDCYTEKHHVIPRCIDKSSKSVVRLTPEEHYVAHQLLTRIYPGNKGLIYAAVRMTQGSNNGTRSNKMYGWLRREWMKVITQPWSEIRRAAQTPEVNERLAAAHRGQTPWNKGRKLEGVSPLKGVPKSEEHKANLRQPKSDAHKAKLSAATKEYFTTHPAHVATEAEREATATRNRERVWSDETRQRMSENYPQEAREALAERNRQKVWTPEELAKNSAAQIAVWVKKNADPVARAALSLQRKESAKRSWAERKAAGALLSPELRAQKEIMRLQKLIANLKAKEKEETA